MGKAQHVFLTRPTDLQLGLYSRTDWSILYFGHWHPYPSRLPTEHCVYDHYHYLFDKSNPYPCFLHKVAFLFSNIFEFHSNIVCQHESMKNDNCTSHCLLHVSLLDTWVFIIRLSEMTVSICGNPIVNDFLQTLEELYDSCYLRTIFYRNTSIKVYNTNTTSNNRNLR